MQVLQCRFLGDNDIESPSIVLSHLQIYCPSIEFVLWYHSRTYLIVVNL